MLQKFFKALAYLYDPIADNEARLKTFHHSLISIFLGFSLYLVVWGLLTFSGAIKLLFGVTALFLLIIAVAHGIYAFNTGQTYWSSRIHMVRRARKTAHDSKADLLAYAEEMKKRTTHGK